MLHKTNETRTRSSAANLCTKNSEFWICWMVRYRIEDIFISDVELVGQLAIQDVNILDKHYI